MEATNEVVPESLSAPRMIAAAAGGGVVPIKALETQRVPMERRGFGRKGQKIQLLSNHFNVQVTKTNEHFYQYSVSICYEDGRSVDGKGIGREVIEKVKETYESELSGKSFAYDGDKTLFTIGPLPGNKLEFSVVLEQLSSSKRNVGSGSPEVGSDETYRKRSKHQIRSKTYKVSINYASKIPMKAIKDALNGNQSSYQFNEAVRVLDIILRQHASKQGCLLVRQSFFHNEPRNFVDLRGGVFGCRGFHSSFRASQKGLSLNIDVSTTMIVKPGPVIDFLLANQDVNHPSQIDWIKAKRMLKNLRIVTATSNFEHKIIGLSDRICREQKFLLRRQKNMEESIETTVYDYYVEHRKLPLTYSGNLPCIAVGKPKAPAYYPIELCTLVSLQRYTKALTNLQRTSLVERSRQNPQERIQVLTDALRRSNYNADPLLESSGISISSQFTQVDGRVLAAPKLSMGNGDEFYPRDGRWNFNGKKLLKPVKIERWVIVNFSARCDVRRLCQDLIKCATMKGISLSNPMDIIEEHPQYRRAPPSIRVEKMFEIMRQKLSDRPDFILCILPEKKNCDIYGPWKRKCLSEVGSVTQCVAPTKINDQYLTNVVLKINAKYGGINSLLCVENTTSIPLVSKIPTLIIGMDVSHGSAGRADVPSIAAVVSSRQWPLISRYRAVVRSQSPKTEMIDSLFKKISDTEDRGIFRELLLDFYRSSGNRKPEHIIIFRDGVSESQFNQVLNIELEQIIQACKFLDNTWSPKFLVIVAQKNHHTKFFQTSSAQNVPPGTVVDNGICHPRNNDFYMCAHAGRIGTSRPTHYHVLHDEIGFSVEDLQELVHSLSYVYQRSTTAISVVAPVCYAHLAAAQVSQFIKFDDISETSSNHSEVTNVGVTPVPELPVLHEKLSSSMFFC